MAHRSKHKDKTEGKYSGVTKVETSLEHASHPMYVIHVSNAKRRLHVHLLCFREKVVNRVQVHIARCGSACPETNPMPVEKKRMSTHSENGPIGTYHR
jgi:hypothetical protein